MSVNCVPPVRTSPNQNGDGALLNPALASSKATVRHAVTGDDASLVPRRNRQMEFVEKSSVPRRGRQKPDTARTNTARRTVLRIVILNLHARLNRAGKPFFKPKRKV